MPSPDEIRDAIQSYIKLMCDSDIDGILDLYDENGKAEDPVGGALQEGKEALRNFYAGTAPKLHVEITGPIRIAGSECAVPLVAEITLGENKLYIDVIDTFCFSEAGKITSMRAYWDPSDMRPNR
jgi:steroid delta-isomerase